MITVICQHCGIQFQTYQYRIKNGYSKYCSKQCYYINKRFPNELKRKSAAKRSAAYRKRHPERIKSNSHYKRQWYLKNKDKILKKLKLNYNPEKTRLYRIKNKNKILLAAKEYRLSGKQAVALSNRRAKIKARSNSVVPTKYLCSMKNKITFCPLCGVVMCSDGRKNNGKTIDHIVPINIGGSHSIKNIRYVCRNCNLSRPKDGRDIRKIDAIEI